MLRSPIYLPWAPEHHAVSHLRKAAALQKHTETETLCEEQMSCNYFFHSLALFLESFPYFSGVIRVSDERNTCLGSFWHLFLSWGLYVFSANAAAITQVAHRGHGGEQSRQQAGTPQSGPFHQPQAHYKSHFSCLTTVFKIKLYKN